MSKIEAGNFVLDEQWIDLGDEIGSATRLIGPRVREAGLILHVDLPTQMPCLLAEARAFRQILLNLLGNAVKFTPHGGRVGVSVAGTDDGSVAISVSDTGVGIAEEDIATVLKPFGQVETALSGNTAAWAWACLYQSGSRSSTAAI